MCRKEIEVAAAKIYSLENWLYELAYEDHMGGRWHDFEDEVILDEAKHMLDLYLEDGSDRNNSLVGEHGEEEKALAAKQVRMLKAFLKKFDYPRGY